MDRVRDLFPASTASEAETRRLGRVLAGRLRSGDVLGLYGDLGTGKTAFTKGVCEGFGLHADDVGSPTFVILKEHRSGRLPVFHFDAYRIDHLAEFFDLGYDEYFYGDGVCVVEWADRVEPLLPDDAIRIRLDHDGGNRRRLRLVSA